MSSSSSIPTEPHSTDDKPSPSLDWRSIAGGAGAASVVAYVSSRLGVAGTITGAAIMSIVAAVTSTYIARAAHQTEQQVRKVTRQMSAAASAHAPTAAESHPAEPDVALPHPEPAAAPETENESETGDGGWPWRRMAILAGVVFVAAIVAVIAVGVFSNADQPLAPRESAPLPAATLETDPQPTSPSATEDEGPTPSPTATATRTSTPTSTATATTTPTGPAGTPSPMSGG